MFIDWRFRKPVGSIFCVDIDEIDPENGINRCSETSAYKHNMVGNNSKNQNW